MDKKDLNFLMIPGELSDPRVRKGLEGHNREREREIYEKAMSCESPLISTSTQNKTGGSLTAASDTPAATPPQKQDYRQAYRDKQDKLMQETQERNSKAAAFEKKQTEERRETDIRNRARDLSEQITYWKSDNAKISHDEQTISGQVNALQNELNTIDSKYWAR